MNFFNCGLEIRAPIFKRLLFLVASAAACHAQDNFTGFEVVIAPPASAFVIDEPVDVKVTIRNRTGQPLKTAAGDRFACEVELLKADGRAVARLAGARLPEVEIQPGASWQGEIRLTDLFMMRAEGDYFVNFSAANRLGSGKTDGVIVSVVPGKPVKQVRQMFSDGTQREFHLVYLQNYQISEDLYLRIVDPAGVRAWDTIFLESFFRWDEPKLDIDETGKVTLLFRIDRDRHYKVVLESTLETVRVVEAAHLADPEAMARLLLEPFVKKALEPPPPPKKWWKFW